MSQDFHEARIVRFDEHMARRGRVISESIEAIKAWRTRAHDEGRPYGFDDYCRAHGLCAACNAKGLVLNDNGIGFKLMGMEDNMYLFELCPECDGTGRARDSQLAK